MGGYIALVPADVRKQPGIAARIGRKLLNAGRAAEALVALENGAPKKHGSYLNDDLYHPGYEGAWIEWEDTYLDATGQTERAQLIRWDAFEERLSVRRLRAYLKALPDFEDIAAEERAVTDEGCITLEFGEPERRAQAPQHRVHHVGDNVLRMVEFSAIEKAGVAGDIGDHETGGFGFRKHIAVPPQDPFVPRFAGRGKFNACGSASASRPHGVTQSGPSEIN